MDLFRSNVAIVFIQTFLGNTNGNDLVSHELIPPIQDRYIRIIPVSWNIHIALRVEFYGCLASKICSVTRLLALTLLCSLWVIHGFK